MEGGMTMDRVRRSCRVLALVAGIIGCWGPRAEAATILSLTINHVTYCAADNNTGCTGIMLTDTDPAADSLVLAGGLLPGSTALLNGLVVTTLDTLVDALTLSSGLTSTSEALSVRLAVSSTDFEGPATTAVAAGSGTWMSAHLGSDARAFWYTDSANDQGAETPGDWPGQLVYVFTNNNTIATLESFSTTFGPVAVSDPALYSMTLALDLFLLPDTSLTTSMSLQKQGTPVPEPVTGILVGAGLLVTRRRRRRRRQ
jgi:hypothetical protein